MGRRFARALIATVVAAFAAAIALAVLDLYLTGHGRPPLGRPWINWPAAGVHLSRADVAMLAVALLAGITRWLRDGGSRGDP